MSASGAVIALKLCGISRRRSSRPHSLDGPTVTDSAVTRWDQIGPAWAIQSPRCQARESVVGKGFRAVLDVRRR